MLAAIFGKVYKPEHETYLKSLFSSLKWNDIPFIIEENYFKQLNNTDKDVQYELYNSYEDLEKLKPDFIITLGGDGTILSAITLIRDLGIPILGINLGRLGFLASTEKEKIDLALASIKAGKYSLVQRTMLSLESNMPIFEKEVSFALNDFTLHKRDTSSMIKIHSYLDGRFLNSYWADGLIVSTPTGSTGYSLSCGGPIVFPNSGNFAITPVAPHNLNVRPIVVPDRSEIKFTIEGRAENYLCTLDSRYKLISTEYEMKISKSDIKVNLIQWSEDNFMLTIRDKLSWGFDARNV